MTTHKFVNNVAALIISTKKCHTPKHLVELYMKYFGKDKQVEGDEFEAHFNTQTTDIGCSKNVLTKHEDEKIPP